MYILYFYEETNFSIADINADIIEVDIIEVDIIEVDIIEVDIIEVDIIEVDIMRGRHYEMVDI